MDIDDLQAQLRSFAADRDWQPFHTPKNLAMALMVEAAELLELFQWLTPQESRSLAQQAEGRERVGEEMADVLIYLLNLAERLDVDLLAATERKIEANARKYPVPESNSENS